MTRIVIIEDHALVRSAFRIMISSHPGMEVTGEGGTCAEAARLIQEQRPDLLLLDMYLPDCFGVDLARRLLELQPGLKIIVVSVGLDAPTLEAARNAGILGYVTKNASEHQLIAAIATVMSGGTCLDAVMEPLPADDPHRAPFSELSSMLTPRQIQVLAMIGQGYSTKAISKELGISSRTVDVHRSQLAKRLQIRDIAGLVHFAFANGLVAKSPA